MSNATRPSSPRQRRKPLEPVHGTAAVLQPVGTIGSPEEQVGQVAINGTAYYLQALDHYRLVRYDEKRRQSTVYDLPADLSSCDCPDATFASERPGGCKHRRGLEVLVGKGKLPRLTCEPVKAHVHVCTLCRRSPVNAEMGEDTCNACLAA